MSTLDDGTDAPFKMPWEFFFYAFGFAVAILYSLTMAKTTRASTWSFLINKVLSYAAPDAPRIQIGSMSFAMLSGQIFLSHLEIRGVDSTVKILRVQLGYNWWYSDEGVRASAGRAESGQTDVPFRLQVQLTGVQVVLHSASSRWRDIFDQMQRNIDERKRGRDKPAEEPVAVEVPIDQLPTIYAWFPVTKISLNTIAILVGSLKLPSFLVLYLETGTVIHTTAGSRGSFCAYESVTHCELVDTALYVTKNPFYSPASEHIKDIKHQLDDDRFASTAMGALKGGVKTILKDEHFFDDLDFQFLPSNQRQPGKDPGSGGDVGGNGSRRGGTSSVRSNDNDSKNNVSSRLTRAASGEVSTFGRKSTYFHTRHTLFDGDMPEDGVELARMRRKWSEEESDEDEQDGKGLMESDHSDDEAESKLEPKEDKHVDLNTSTASNSSKQSEEAAMSQDPISLFWQRQKQYILKCALLHLTYRYDVATLMTEEDQANHMQLKQQGTYKEEEQEPQQTIDLDAETPLKLYYGPWMDNQRALLMTYFLPNTFENQEIGHVEVGQLRLIRNLNLNVTFHAASSLDLPFRQWTRLQLKETLSPPEDAIDSCLLRLRFGANSTLQYIMNSVPSDAQGSFIKIKAALLHAKLIPVSLTNRVLLDQCNLELDIDMLYPIEWNDVYNWRFGITIKPSDSSVGGRDYARDANTAKQFFRHNTSENGAENKSRHVRARSTPQALQKRFGNHDDYGIEMTEFKHKLPLPEQPSATPYTSSSRKPGSQKPKVWLLKDHIAFFQDLIGDWMAYKQQFQQLSKGIGVSPEPDLTYHYPVRYTYDLKFLDVDIVLHVNENNLVDNYNDPATNSLLHITTPELSAVITVPMLKFKAVGSDVTYTVNARNPDFELRMPDNHPMSDLSAQKMTVLKATSLGITGRYAAHYNFNANYRDSNTMDFDIQGLELFLFGQYIRYLWAFKDNYFGETQNSISTQDFCDSGFRNLASYTQEIIYNEHEDFPHNAFETAISIRCQNNIIYLPSNLFAHNARHAPTIKLHDFSFDMRSLQQYFHMNICCSPITVTIPLHKALSTGEDENAEVELGGWTSQETYLHVSDLTWTVHDSIGVVDPLLPVPCVYRGRWTVNFGEITAQLLPEQVVSLTNSVTHIIQQHTDSANLSFPKPCTPEESAQFIQDCKNNNAAALAHSSDDTLSAHKLRQLTVWSEHRNKEGLADSEELFQAKFVSFTLLHRAMLTSTAKNVSRETSREKSSEHKHSEKMITHSHSRALTRVVLPRGLTAKTTTFITSSSNASKTLEVPILEASYLCSEERDREKDRWTALASFAIEAPLNVVSATQSSDWAELRRQQHDFIYGQAELLTESNTGHESYAWHDWNAAHVTSAHKSTSTSLNKDDPQLFSYPAFARRFPYSGGSRAMFSQSKAQNPTMHKATISETDLKRNMLLGRDGSGTDLKSIPELPEDMKNLNSVLFGTVDSEHKASLMEEDIQNLYDPSESSASSRASTHDDGHLTSGSDEDAHDGLGSVEANDIMAELESGTSSRSLSRSSSSGFSRSSSLASALYNDDDVFLSCDEATSSDSGEEDDTRFKEYLSTDYSDESDVEVVFYDAVTSPTPGSRRVRLRSRDMRGNAEQDLNAPVARAVATFTGHLGPYLPRYVSRRVDQKHQGKEANLYMRDVNLAGTRAAAYLAMPCLELLPDELSVAFPRVHLAAQVNHAKSSETHTKSTLEQPHNKYELYEDVAHSEALEGAVRQTSKLVVESQGALTCTLTPGFLSSLDKFSALVDSTSASVEDTLDELHRQLHTAFAEARSNPLMVAKRNTECMADTVGYVKMLVSLPLIECNVLQEVSLGAAGGVSRDKKAAARATASSSSAHIIRTRAVVAGLELLSDSTIAPDFTSVRSHAQFASACAFAHFVASVSSASNGGHESPPEGPTPGSPSGPRPPTIEEDYEVLLGQRVTPLNTALHFFGGRHSVENSSQQSQLPGQQVLPRRAVLGRLIFAGKVLDLSVDAHQTTPRKPPASIPVVTGSFGSREFAVDSLQRFMRVTTRRRATNNVYGSDDVSDDTDSKHSEESDDTGQSGSEDTSTSGYQPFSHQQMSFSRNVTDIAVHVAHADVLCAPDGPLVLDDMHATATAATRTSNFFALLAQNVVPVSASGGEIDIPLLCKLYFDITASDASSRRARVAGGPRTLAQMARWQTLFAFALEHISHVRAFDESRGDRGFNRKEQLRLLMWLSRRSDVSPLGFALSRLLGDSQDTFSNQNASYIFSACAPLTIVMRKLLSLSPELQRKLQHLLQRSHEPFSVDYWQVFENQKTELTGMSQTVVNLVVYLVPQALRLTPLTPAFRPFLAATSPSALDPRPDKLAVNVLCTGASVKVVGSSPGSRHNVVRNSEDTVLSLRVESLNIQTAVTMKQIDMRVPRALKSHPVRWMERLRVTNLHKIPSSRTLLRRYQYSSAHKGMTGQPKEVKLGNPILQLLRKTEVIPTTLDVVRKDIIADVSIAQLVMDVKPNVRWLLESVSRLRAMDSPTVVPPRDVGDTVEQDLDVEEEDSRGPSSRGSFTSTGTGGDSGQSTPNEGMGRGLGMLLDEKDKSDFLLAQRRSDTAFNVYRSRQEFGLTDTGASINAPRSFQSPYSRRQSNSIVQSVSVHAGVNLMRQYSQPVVDSLMLEFAEFENNLVASTQPLFIASAALRILAFGVAFPGHGRLQLVLHKTMTTLGGCHGDGGDSKQKNEMASWRQHSDNVDNQPILEEQEGQPLSLALSSATVLVKFVDIQLIADAHYNQADMNMRVNASGMDSNHEATTTSGVGGSARQEEKHSKNKKPQHALLFALSLTGIELSMLTLREAATIDQPQAEPSTHSPQPQTKVSRHSRDSPFTFHDDQIAKLSGVPEAKSPSNNQQATTPERKLSPPKMTSVQLQQGHQNVLTRIAEIRVVVPLQNLNVVDPAAFILEWSDTFAQMKGEEQPARNPMLMSVLLHNIHISVAPTTHVTLTYFLRQCWLRVRRQLTRHTRVEFLFGRPGEWNTVAAPAQNSDGMTSENQLNGHTSSSRSSRPHTPRSSSSTPRSTRSAPVKPPPPPDSGPGGSGRSRNDQWFQIKSRRSAFEPNKNRRRDEHESEDEEDDGIDTTQLRMPLPCLLGGFQLKPFSFVPVLAPGERARSKQDMAVRKATAIEGAIAIGRMSNRFDEAFIFRLIEFQSVAVREFSTLLSKISNWRELSLTGEDKTAALNESHVVKSSSHKYTVNVQLLIQAVMLTATLSQGVRGRSRQLPSIDVSTGMISLTLVYDTLKVVAPSMLRGWLTEADVGDDIASLAESNAADVIVRVGFKGVNANVTVPRIGSSSAADIEHAMQSGLANDVTQNLTLGRKMLLGGELDANMTMAFNLKLSSSICAIAVQNVFGRLLAEDSLLSAMNDLHWAYVRAANELKANKRAFQKEAQAKLRKAFIDLDADRHVQRAYELARTQLDLIQAGDSPQGKESDLFDEMAETKEQLLGLGVQPLMQTAHQRRQRIAKKKKNGISVRVSVTLRKLDLAVLFDPRHTAFQHAELPRGQMSIPSKVLSPAHGNRSAMHSGLLMLFDLLKVTVSLTNADLTSLADAQLHVDGPQRDNIELASNLLASHFEFAFLANLDERLPLEALFTDARRRTVNAQGSRHIYASTRHAKHSTSAGKTVQAFTYNRLVIERCWLDLSGLSPVASVHLKSGQANYVLTSSVEVTGPRLDVNPFLVHHLDDVTHFVNQASTKLKSQTEAASAATSRSAQSFTRELSGGSELDEDDRVDMFHDAEEGPEDDEHAKEHKHVKNGFSVSVNGHITPGHIRLYHLNHMNMVTVFPLPDVALNYLLESETAYEPVSHVALVCVTLPDIVVKPALLNFAVHVRDELEEVHLRNQDRLVVDNQHSSKSDQKEPLHEQVSAAPSAAHSVMLNVSVFPASLVFACDPVDAKVGLKLSLEHPRDHKTRALQINYSTGSIMNAAEANTNNHRAQNGHDLDDSVFHGRIGYGTGMIVMPSVSVALQRELKPGNRRTSGDQREPDLFAASRRATFMNLQLQRLHAFLGQSAAFRDDGGLLRTSVARVDHIDCNLNMAHVHDVFVLDVAWIQPLMRVLDGWSPPGSQVQPDSNKTDSTKQNDSHEATTTAHVSITPLPSVSSVVRLDSVRVQFDMRDVPRVGNVGSIVLGNAVGRAFDLGSSGSTVRPALIHAHVNALDAVFEPVFEGFDARLKCAGAELNLTRVPFLGDGELAPLPVRASKSGEAVQVVPKHIVNTVRLAVEPVSAKMSYRLLQLFKLDSSRITLNIADVPRAAVNDAKEGPFHENGEEDDLFAFNGMNSSLNRSTGNKPLLAHPGEDQAWDVMCDLDLGKQLIVVLSRSAIPQIAKLSSEVVKYVVLEKSKLKSDDSTSIKSPSRPNTPSSARSDVQRNGRHRNNPKFTLATQEPSQHRTAASHNGNKFSDDADARIEAFQKAFGDGTVTVKGHLIELHLVAGTVTGGGDALLMQLVEFEVRLERAWLTENQNQQTGDFIFTEDLGATLYRLLTAHIGHHVKVYDTGDTYRWQRDEARDAFKEPGLKIYRDGTPPDAIIELPTCVLEMETLDPLSSPTFTSDFSVFWDRSITVTPDFRLYKYLKATLDSVGTQVERASQEVTGHLEHAATPSKTKPETPSRRQREKREAKQAEKVTGKNEWDALLRKRLGDDSMCNLNNPQMNVLHNASGGISIQTILAYFQEGTVSSVLPTATRDHLTTNLDEVLNAALQLSRDIDARFG